jgi:large subunit ribosomal protein L13
MAEYHIDAKHKRLGRLATEIATILSGKKTADYAPNKVADVKVYVKNFAQVEVTGNKLLQKVYYRHTGYVGHLKEERLEEVMTKHPERALQEAVRKMLPKNFLNARRLKNLIFVENDAVEGTKKKK